MFCESGKWREEECAHFDQLHSRRTKKRIYRSLTQRYEKQILLHSRGKLRKMRIGDIPLPKTSGKSLVRELWMRGEREEIRVSTYLPRDQRDKNENEERNG